MREIGRHSIFQKKKETFRHSFFEIFLQDYFNFIDNEWNKLYQTINVRKANMFFELKNFLFFLVGEHFTACAF